MPFLCLTSGTSWTLLKEWPRSVGRSAARTQCRCAWWNHCVTVVIVCGHACQLLQTELSGKNGKETECSIAWHVMLESNNIASNLWVSLCLKLDSTNLVGS